MTSPLALGALAGALFAAGAWLVWARLPGRRRLTLADRIAPYLRDAPPPSRLLAPGPVASPSLVRRLLAPAVASAASALQSALGGAGSVASRQARAGHPVDVSSFRAQQVVWGSVGAAVGLVLGTMVWLRSPGSVGPAAMVVLLATAGGVLVRDRALTIEVERRETRILAEFPTVAELLALSVAAGEGTAAALERVCRVSSGELARELRICLTDARAGATLPVALRGLSQRTGLPGLARFVDGVVIALDRGTPLAEVLRAQAQDAREEGRRAVMEAAGRKEVLMMMPVVFLVLPVTVVFAVYPGLISLRFSP